MVSHLTLPKNLEHLFNEFVYGGLHSFFFFLGRTGVQVFFVISGFLITYFLIKEKETTGQIDYRRFYIRRVLRIMPAFYAFLLVLLIINWLTILEIPVSAFLSAALYIHNFHPWGISWFLGHTWSLSVEEQFYLLWPALFPLALRFGKTWHWVVSLVISAIARSLYYKFPEESKFLLVDFLMYSDYLFSGCLMAFLTCYKPDTVLAIIKNRFAPILMCIAIALTLYLPSAQYHPDYDTYLIPTMGTITNLSICYVIFYFIHRKQSIGYMLLNSGVAVFVGRLSYSLYLWQQFFLPPDPIWWFNHIPYNFIATFAAALCSYYLVELPFLRLKTKFEIFTHG